MHHLLSWTYVYSWARVHFCKRELKDAYYVIGKVVGFVPKQAVVKVQDPQDGVKDIFLILQLSKHILVQWNSQKPHLGKNIRIHTLHKGRDLPFVFWRFEGKSNFKSRFFWSSFFLLVTQLFDLNSLFHSEKRSQHNVMSKVNSWRHE